MASLFKAAGLEKTAPRPLADRLRPENLADVVGQDHLLRPDGALTRMLDAMGGLAVMAAIGARHLDEPPLQRLQRFGKLGTIDLRVDYLRPGIGDRFELRAAVLRLGSRVATTRMEFFDASGKGNLFGDEFEIAGIPTMWLVDKSGLLRELNAQERLVEKVEKLLAE